MDCLFGAPCMQTEAASPVADADEADNADISTSATDTVAETRPETVAMDPNLAAATTAKVRCLLSRKKVHLIFMSCKCSASLSSL